MIKPKMKEINLFKKNSKGNRFGPISFDFYSFDRIQVHTSIPEGGGGEVSRMKRTLCLRYGAVRDVYRHIHENRYIKCQQLN